MKISVKNTATGNIAKIEVDFEKKQFNAIDIPKDLHMLQYNQQKNE